MSSDKASRLHALLTWLNCVQQALFTHSNPHCQRHDQIHAKPSPWRRKEKMHINQQIGISAEWGHHQFSKSKTKEATPQSNIQTNKACSKNEKHWLRKPGDWSLSLVDLDLEAENYGMMFALQAPGDKIGTVQYDCGSSRCWRGWYFCSVLTVPPLQHWWPIIFTHCAHGQTIDFIWSFGWHCT